MNPGWTVRTIAILVLLLLPVAYAAFQINPGQTLTTLCGSDCECLTESEAYSKFDDPVRCSTTTCGETWVGEFKFYKYCYKDNVQLVIAPEPEIQELCPGDCECLTDNEASNEFGAGKYQQCSPFSCGSKYEKEFKALMFCYGPITAEDCIDTDGGKVYDVKGSTPMCEDACSEFSQNPQTVLKECYVELDGDECIVGVDNHDCNSICENGVCLPPTCDDWIENQDEEGVDCGGSCPIECACPSGYKCSTVVEAEQEYGSGAVIKYSNQPCGHAWQGDLQLNQYCHKKVGSYDCVDSDGGPDVMVKGHAPGCEDYCLTNRILKECTVTPGIDDCEVHVSEWQCEGACKDGACQPPSCEDGIQNQDEVSIDCSPKSIFSTCEDCCNNGLQDYDEEGIDCGGTDCIPCGWVGIKGKIVYEDTDTATGQFKPVRHAKFRLRLCEENPCQTPVAEAEWTTDSQGKFSFMVPKSNYQSAYILFGDPNDFFDINYAVRLTKDLDGCNEYVYWLSYSHALPATGTLNMGELKIGMNSNMDFEGHWAETTDGTCSWDGNEKGDIAGGSAYFNIADAILYSRQYADGKRGDSDSIGYVDVQYPDADWSNYDPMWEEITLIQGEDDDGDWADHGFEDGVSVHEFAHHLQTTIGENDDYWGDGSHTFCTYGKDEEFAWSEGFAEYFGTIVPFHHDAISSPDKDYDYIESIDCAEFGWEGEATVAAFLWDLADDKGTIFTESLDEYFDTISGKETLIFQVFDDELDNFGDAPDLCEFVEEGWNCRTSGAEKTAIEGLLTSFLINECDEECDD